MRTDLAIEFVDLIDLCCIGGFIDAGTPHKLLEKLGGISCVRLFEGVAEEGYRLVDFFNQKKVSLALAFVSAEAVNGMRVV